MFVEAFALVCIAWYISIIIISCIGYIQLFSHYRSKPRCGAVLTRSEIGIPHVTAIRPCKGLEPYLYECLASTLQQDYPASKLTVHFCVSSRQDPAYPIVRTLLDDHPHHDAQLFVEDEDEKLLSGRLGPNPKIRNMSRAYREAKGDAIWIIDCNVWVNSGACARMVDRLYGYAHGAKRQRPYKLVHHLPVAIDVPATSTTPVSPQTAQIANGHVPYATVAASPASASPPTTKLRYGGRLEELFLSSSHAKFYTAINTVSIAPCIVGKSTMFRRSHLDSLTNAQGIDFFSYNICEDHLIGDLLWKSKLSTEPVEDGKDLKLRNHGIVFGDLAVQPVADMSVSGYIARRVRWLRVRKFTVPAATLVEPGTESLLCSTMGVWGLSRSVTAREWLSRCTATDFGERGSWQEMLLLFTVSMLIWCTVDRTVHLLLHSGATIETKKAQAQSTTATDMRSHDASEMNSTAVPPFILPPSHTIPTLPHTCLNYLKSPLTTLFALISSIPDLQPRRPFSSWLRAWLGRELLALPIWLWAIWGGVTVEWRGRKLWVGWDMKVHEVNDGAADARTGVNVSLVSSDATASGKDVNGSVLRSGSDAGARQRQNLTGPRLIDDW